MKPILQVMFVTEFKQYERCAVQFRIGYQDSAKSDVTQEVGEILTTYWFHAGVPAGSNAVYSRERRRFEFDAGPSERDFKNSVQEVFGTNGIPVEIVQHPTGIGRL